MIITERKTRKELIRKIPNQSSASIMNALKTLAVDTGDLFSTVFKSLTPFSGVFFYHFNKCFHCWEHMFFLMVNQLGIHR